MFVTFINPPPNTGCHWLPVSQCGSPWTSELDTVFRPVGGGLGNAATSGSPVQRPPLAGQLPVAPGEVARWKAMSWSFRCHNHAR